MECWVLNGEPSLNVTLQPGLTVDSISAGQAAMALGKNIDDSILLRRTSLPSNRQQILLLGSKLIQRDKSGYVFEPLLLDIM